MTALAPLLLVGAGGAMGAVARHLLGRWALAVLGPGFPYGTWIANIAGGLAMGVLAATLARTGGSEQLRLLLGVGLLGGFTTFSAFSLEVYEMILRGEALLALAYAMSSVAGAVVALWGGAMLVRAFA